MTVVCFSAHNQVALAIDIFGKAFADDRVIVHQKDASFTGLTILVHHTFEGHGRKPPFHRCRCQRANLRLGCGRDSP